MTHDEYLCLRRYIIEEKKRQLKQLEQKRLNRELQHAVQLVLIRRSTQPLPQKAGQP